jgi:hypothetical protein
VVLPITVDFCPDRFLGWSEEISRKKGTEQGIGFASSDFFLCLSLFISSKGGQVRVVKKRSFLL